MENKIKKVSSYISSKNLHLYKYTWINGEANITNN